MKEMHVDPEWHQIALRLFLTIIAGTLLGIDRSERGRPAGLRTTLLVCLSASVAMIQTNLLLSMQGKPPGSFVTLDLMRLPLGILSGMGFIGAGTILRRDNLVLGVTTAATLWFATILGLCFGGGQLVLGSVALAIGLLVLLSLRWVERELPQDRYASLVVTLGPGRLTDQELWDSLRGAGLQVVVQGVTYDSAAGRRELHCDVRWRARLDENPAAAFLKDLSELPGVSALRWSSEGPPAGK
jgi:putative Mg2+ transporter-C (MgtC) family protein